jgi:hypothetical protein
MPSSSKKQHNFMEAIAHSPAFARKVGVPQSVGREFSTADKGRKFAKGGDMATKGVNPFAKFEKSGKDVEVKGKGKEGSKKEEAFDKSQMGMKRGGTAMYKSFSNSGKPAGMKPVQKMAEGGMMDKAQDKAMIKKAFKQHDMQEHMGGKGTTLKLAKGGMHAMPNGKMMKNSAMKMASGGFTKAADGIARQGKTQATQIKMKRGGGC